MSEDNIINLDDVVQENKRLSQVIDILIDIIRESRFGDDYEKETGDS